MPSLAATADGPGRLSRLGRLIVDSTVGTLLCTGPVTAVIALGWLTRRQSHLARARFGAVEDPQRRVHRDDCAILYEISMHGPTSSIERLRL